MKLRIELTTDYGTISQSIAASFDADDLTNGDAHDARLLMDELRTTAKKIEGIFTRAASYAHVRGGNDGGELVRGAIAIPTADPQPGETIGADGEVTRRVGAQPGAR